MSVDELLAPLSHVPLLAGLQMAQLAEMARRAEKLKYAPGDVLMKTGQPGDAACLIISGAVDRIDASETSAVERVAPGTLLAEMAMFVEHTYSATCIARERVYCLKLTRAAMHAQMLEDATLIEHFQQRFTESVQRLAEQLRQMDAKSAAVGSAASSVKSAPKATSDKPLQPAEAAATPPTQFVAAPRAWR